MRKSILGTEEPRKLNPNIKWRHKGPGLIRNKTVRATKPAQSLKVNWVIFCVTAYPFYLGHWLLPHFVVRARSRPGVSPSRTVLLPPGSPHNYTYFPMRLLGYLFTFFLLANWKKLGSYSISTLLRVFPWKLDIPF